LVIHITGAKAIE